MTVFFHQWHTGLRRVPSRVLPTALCLLAADGLGAQEYLTDGPSVLGLLPLEGTLVVGHDTLGTLTETDYLLDGGRRAVAWGIRLDRDQQMGIDLRSTVFDSYLYIVGPVGDQVADPDDVAHYTMTDDDSGGGLNAQLCFTAPDPGSYRIVVAALYAEVGEYTLSARDSCRSGALPDNEGAFPLEATYRLAIGHEMEGQLTDQDQEIDGRYTQIWSVDVVQGETLGIAVESSDFDTYLVVHTPDGRWLLDDDAGTGTNSRITFDTRLTATSHIAVSSFDGSLGAFRLRVVRIPTALNPGY